MKILIVDTETTGFDIQNDHLIEVAALLWSVNNKDILAQISTTISYREYISNPAEPINGISSTLLSEDFPYQSALKLISEMAKSAKYICAHNAPFDKEFCEKTPGLNLPSMGWIDTQDIRYPKSRYSNSSSLSNLAIVHSIPIVDAHRALDDCRTLAKLLSQVENLPKELHRAARPKVLVKSLEEKPGRLSKANGFKWNSIIPYAWAKLMPEEDIKSLPFNATKVLEKNEMD